MLRKAMKKGFSLVEMLIVIAIIALLVSVTIPVVQAATTKAAAATNAANLRAIEGQLATLRVQNEDAFDSLVDNATKTVEDVLNEMGLDPNVAHIVCNLANDLISGLLEAEDSAIANYANYLVYNHTADDGVLSLNGTIELKDVPTSKAVSCGDLNIGKDVQMTIYITEKNVIASYESETGRYTKEDFAEIAATGKYTGKAEGSGGQTGEDAKEDAKEEVEDVFNCWLGEHEDGNSDYNCDHCGKVLEHTHRDGKDDYYDGVCDINGCGAAASHGHTDDDKNGICDKNGCGQPYHECKNDNGDCACDFSGCTTTYHTEGKDACGNANGKCSKCGAGM